MKTESFVSGEIRFEMLNLGPWSGKYEWEYVVTNNVTCEHIANGRELRTFFDNPAKAVQDLIGFMTCDDRELFRECGWTHDADNFMGMLEYDEEASEYETVYVINRI